MSLVRCLGRLYVITLCYSDHVIVQLQLEKYMGHLKHRIQTYPFMFPSPPCHHLSPLDLSSLVCVLHFSPGTGSLCFISLPQVAETAV